MDLPLIAVIFQSISSLSIAGGLIFAAYQFWHVRRAQHVANFTKLVELQMHLREMRVHSPDLADIYSHDVAGLGGPAQVRAYFFNLMQVSVFEIVWFAHRNGQVPDGYFRSWDKRMREIAREPSFQAMIDRPAMKILHDEFQEYVERMAAQVREGGGRGPGGGEA